MKSTQTPLHVRQITVEIKPDDAPDTSTIGEYTDTSEDWVIIRNGDHAGEYVRTIIDRLNRAEEASRAICNKIAELRDSETDWSEAIDRLDAAERRWLEEIDTYQLPERGREYRFFKPYGGGEKPGSEDYQKNGLHDWKRMESLNRGEWCFVGIYAKLAYQIGKHGVIQTLRSGGLWGIESDSGKEYVEGIGKEELDALKGEAEALGIRWPKKKAKEALSAAVEAW